MVYSQNFTALTLSLQTIAIISPMFIIPLHSASNTYYSFQNIKIFRSIPTFLSGNRFKSAYICDSHFSHFLSSVISINSQSPDCPNGVVIANSSTPDVHIFNCSFTEIKALAFNCTNNSLRLFTCNFSSCRSKYGAVYHTNGYLSSNNCNYENNLGNITGALYHNIGEFYLYRSSFHFNFAMNYIDFYAVFNYSVTIFYINYCYFGISDELKESRFSHGVEPLNCSITYTYCKFSFSENSFNKYCNNTSNFNQKTNEFGLGNAAIYMHKAPSSFFTLSNIFTFSEQFSLSSDFSESLHFTESNDFVQTLGFTRSILFSQSQIFTNSHSFTGTVAFSHSDVFTQSTEYTISSVFTISNNFIQSSAFTASRQFSPSQQFTNSETFTPNATQTPSISPIPTKSPQPSMTPTNPPTPSDPFTKSLEFTPSNTLSSPLPNPPPSSTPNPTAVPRVLTFSALGIVMTVLGVSIAITGLIANGILCAYMAQAGEIIITQQI